MGGVISKIFSFIPIFQLASILLAASVFLKMKRDKEMSKKLVIKSILVVLLGIIGTPTTPYLLYFYFGALLMQFGLL